MPARAYTVLAARSKITTNYSQLKHTTIACASILRTASKPQLIHIMLIVQQSLTNDTSQLPILRFTQRAIGQMRSQIPIHQHRRLGAPQLELPQHERSNNLREFGRPPVLISHDIVIPPQLERSRTAKLKQQPHAPEVLEFGDVHNMRSFRPGHERFVAGETQAGHAQRETADLLYRVLVGRVLDPIIENPGA